MTFSTETRPAPTAVGLIAGFGRQMLIGFHQWKRRRRDEASLKSLDDHLLNDIGLRRDHTGRVFRP